MATNVNYEGHPKDVKWIDNVIKEDVSSVKFIHLFVSGFMAYQPL